FSLRGGLGAHEQPFVLAQYQLQHPIADYLAHLSDTRLRPGRTNRRIRNIQHNPIPLFLLSEPSRSLEFPKLRKRVPPKMSCYGGLSQERCWRSHVFQRGLELGCEHHDGYITGRGKDAYSLEIRIVAPDFFGPYLLSRVNRRLVNFVAYSGGDHSQQSDVDDPSVIVSRLVSLTLTGQLFEGA
ncbi:unnamed protein product, partial [Rhizoctonia solani]